MTLDDQLRDLLSSYAEPCIGDCDHSQCPLLRELHALRIRAALERAQHTVKPIADHEQQGELIGDLMNLRLQDANTAPSVPGETGETRRVEQIAEDLTNEIYYHATNDRARLQKLLIEFALQIRRDVEPVRDPCLVAGYHVCGGKHSPSDPWKD